MLTSFFRDLSLVLSASEHSPYLPTNYIMRLWIYSWIVSHYLKYNKTRGPTAHFVNLLIGMKNRINRNFFFFHQLNQKKDSSHTVCDLHTCNNLFSNYDALRIIVLVSEDSKDWIWFCFSEDTWKPPTWSRGVIKVYFGSSLAEWSVPRYTGTGNCQHRLCTSTGQANSNKVLLEWHRFRVHDKSWNSWRIWNKTPEAFLRFNGWFLRLGCDVCHDIGSL